MLNALAMKLTSAVCSAADGLIKAQLVPANGVPAIDEQLASASDREKVQGVAQKPLYFHAVGPFWK